MAIGVGTYAYLWRGSEDAPRIMGLHEMLEDASRLGARVFQICDHLPLAAMERAGLAEVRAHARQLGLSLELGTRGVGSQHLLRTLETALALDCRLVRSMVEVPHGREDAVESAVRALTVVMPEYERAGVVLALETYEGLSTGELVRLIRRVDSDRLGVCLDAANCLAGLETPRAVVETVAALVRNIHAKDFVYSRKPRGQGFDVSGAALGTGSLDYPSVVGLLRPRERNVNEVLENWLGWQGDWAATCALEREWTSRGFEYLRNCG